MDSKEKETLRNAILRMPDLPTLPSNVTHLMDMMRDSESSTSEVIKLIEQDQVLSARILKLLNSSYYSQTRPISSIGYAVTLMGQREVYNLLISSSVMEIISAEALDLWNHSCASSALISKIVEEERIRCARTIQLTALMHDLGKIVLMNFDPDRYAKVQSELANSSGPIHDAESAIFGVDHAEVGAWLLESWKLAEEQFIPIAQHHMEGVPENYEKETALLQIINYIDHEVRGTVGKLPNPALLDAAGMSEIDLDEWKARHETLVEEMAETASVTA